MAKDSQRSHHLTTTSPLLGEHTFTPSNPITSLPMVGVLTTSNFLNNHSFTFPNNITYHFLQLNYPLKGNQTNIRSNTPSKRPHVTSHISSFLSINPNFIMASSRNKYIIVKALEIYISSVAHKYFQFPTLK